MKLTQNQPGLVEGRPLSSAAPHMVGSLKVSAGMGCCLWL